MEDDQAELVFLLSSQNRVDLMRLLRVEELRLSALASKLDMTVQETSRQLARLEKANLVERDSRSTYGLTDTGRVAVALLPSFDFLTRNREYLTTHNLSSLPLKFLERIGELSENEYSDNLSAILKHVGRVVNEAKDYVWLMADHILLIDSIAGRIFGDETGNLQWRILVPSAAVASVESQDLPDLSQRVELRFVETVRVGLSINEKLAGLTFPDKTGKVDFNCGFRSSAPLFHDWCRDLFELNWDRSKSVPV